MKLEIISNYASGLDNINIKLFQSAGVSIYNNNYTGLYTWGNDLIFDPVNRCSIYNNFTENNYYQMTKDIRVSPNGGPYDVYLDIFTVLEPTEEYAYPLESFNFDILNYYSPHDLTGDGILDIIDIVFLINFIFSEEAEYEAQLDINQDGWVDILDIITIVNIIFDN